MKRLPQILLIGTFIGFSWLAMQVVHEAGHVLVARLTGAEVTKVALHPLIVSRTDVAENPHPLAVVWGGPLVGALLPLLLFAIANVFRLPGAYLLRFFAGFCLIANGVYIGIGHFLAEGADPWVMMENGSPRWLLVLFWDRGTSAWVVFVASARPTLRPWRQGCSWPLPEPKWCGMCDNTSSHWLQEEEQI